MRRSTLCLCLVSLAIACGGGEPSGDGSATAPTSASASLSMSATASGTGTSSTGGGATEGATGSSTAGSSAAGETSGGASKFDIGSVLDIGSGDTTCKKVDVLFIIDNSPSMYDEQQTLIANFGNFVADMQAALADVDDYHIGVITTDNYVDEGFLDDSSPTVNVAVPQCRLLGGLVAQGQAGLCTPLADGGHYISEMDDLEAKFQCVANVGEDGDSDERVGDALIEALKPGIQAQGACNEGFLRWDALLVIVILTDENDASDSSTTDWYASVVAAKKSPENAVVLALIWDMFEDGCQESLSESTGWQIEEFAMKFPNHAVGSICDDSYAGFFSSVVPVIDSACDNFIPPR